MFGFDFALVGGALGVLLTAVVCIVIYFIPWFVAYTRKTKNCGIIFLVNLLVAWTAIGWLAVFIWAVVEKPNE